MGKRLLIVESPGKTKKLSQILGSEWIVKASMGHVRELASDGIDSLGFDLESNSVHCRYVARGDRGNETIQQLQSVVKQVETVVLATDPDREGETIAWHLQQALKLKKVQRVVYTEITPAAVRSAIAHPRLLDQNLVNSGLCRAVLDKLVGFKGSPLLWSLNNGAKSMGRVQSAALHIVCQREQQIQAFVPQDYWSVYVDYEEGYRAYYQGTLNAAEAEDPQHDDAASSTEAQVSESERVLSEAEANRLVQQAQLHPHKLVKVEGKPTTRTPPAAFSTSTLQQAAGSKLRFSPEHTMQIAQKLYEAGLITYMRTDSVALSPDFCTAARRWLEAHDPDNVPKKVAVHRSSTGAQEAHAAIRPTDLTRPSNQMKVELSADEFNLYLLIWKRAVASQCQAARLRKTRLVSQSGSIIWQARGQVVEFPGYSRYWNNLSADSELPALQQGQLLRLQQAAHEQKQTSPPPRYSEPKLVQVMERRGIGRPSTYAPTIQTLKQRQYVEATKGQLQPTPLGLEVDQFLGQALPDLLEAEFTAQMELALDQIAAGQEDWQQYVTTWNYDYFVPALERARKLVVSQPSNNAAVPKGTATLSRTQCPQCRNYLAKIPSKKVKKKYFLKCISGCEDVVLFWSDREKQWEQPRSRAPNRKSTGRPPVTITTHACPVCPKPLEEYRYEKEGQQKSLLRCSDPSSHTDKKHKEALYFKTQSGWWSPKYGELP